MSLKIGNKVKIEKTEGYISPLSIYEFPSTFKLVMWDLDTVNHAGETGKIIDIIKGVPYPDLYKYVILLDSVADRAWYPHWWLKKVENNA